MAEVQHLIQVSDYEQRLMVNGLNAFRNDLIRDGKPTEPACKGSTFKGPFHLPRMLSITDQVIGEILNAQ